MILIIVDCIKPASGETKVFTEMVNDTCSAKEILVLAHSDLGLIVNILIKIWHSRYTRFLRKYEVFSCFIIPIFYRLLPNLIINRVHRAYEAKSVHLVWTKANDILPLIGAQLADLFHCKLHISIFDLPFTFRYAKTEIKEVESSFSQWVNRAESFDYASEGMRDYLKTQYNINRKSLVIWSSEGTKLEKNPSYETRKDVHSIVYCGSLRFFNEIFVLSQAVSVLNERYGFKIVIKIYSHQRINYPNIEYHKYLESENVLISRLKLCDIAYTPMSFCAEDAVLSSTSFPGKIATYLSSGLPIIAHAPSHASNFIFINKNQIGIGIDSLNPFKVAEAIAAYAKDYALRSVHSSNTYLTLRKCFNRQERNVFFNCL